MYVPSLTVVAGWAVLFEAAILVAYGVVLFVFFSLFIRLYEEPRLARDFGPRLHVVRIPGQPLVAQAPSREGRLKCRTLVPAEIDHAVGKALLQFLDSGRRHLRLP